MGWLDYHLHEFEVRADDGQDARRFGIPDPDGWDTVPIEPDWEQAVMECMARPGDEAMYTYDFGDDWIFDATAVRFSDPRKRLRQMLKG